MTNDQVQRVLDWDYMLAIRVPTHQTPLVYLTVSQTAGRIGYVTTFMMGADFWDELHVDLGSLPAIVQRLGDALVAGRWDPQEATNVRYDNPERLKAEHRGAVEMYHNLRAGQESNG